MRYKRLLCGLALAGLASGFSAYKAWAIGPAPLAPRGPFVLMVTLTSNMAGDFGPLGTLPIGTGVDGTGPFFTFDIDAGGTKYTWTYRPRADTCGPCSVREFGDGGIAAVADFRSQYERWKRSSHPAGGLAGVLAVPFGGFPQSVGPIALGLSVAPGDVMLSPIAPGVGGAALHIVFDPTTNTFEDYKFEYSSAN
jgi:hypothetical protein